MAEAFDFGLQQHKIKMDGKFFESNLFAVAGDTGRRLEVQLLNSDNLVQNTTGISLRLNANVAGKATYAEATLVDATQGMYELDLPNGMLMAPGNWQFQWQLIGANGEKLHSFAFMGTIGSNLAEGGSEATNFYLNVDDLKQMQEDLVNGTFNSEVLETNIAEKLTDLETQYTPKLTEVTAQLAHKITKGQATVADINKNLGKFDESYMSDTFLQQIAGATPIGAVPADLGVTSRKIASGAVNLTKLDAEITANLAKYKQMVYTITADKYYERDTGVLTSSVGRRAIKVNCNPNDKLKATTKLPGSAGAAMAIFFKFDGSYHSYLNSGVSGTEVQYTDYEFVVPQDAYAVAIDGNATLMQLSRVESIDVNDLLKDVAVHTDDLGQYVSVSEAPIEGAYYHGVLGTLQVGSDKKHIKAACNAGDKFMCTTTVSGAAIAMVVFLQANGSFLSSINRGVNGLNTTYTNVQFTVPNGAYFVVVDGQLANPISLSLKQLNQVGAKVTDNTYRIGNLETKTTSYWKNKKIVWFGTSIPEGKYDGLHSYPVLIGEKLGATVVNESKGSSCVRAGYTRLVTGEDIYGWTGKPWQNIVYSLSQTLAEKNELINNWAYWKTKLTNTPPDTLDTTAQALIRDCSYENRLVARHLGDGKRADLYVFDHGYNDIDYTNLDLNVLPTNNYDRKYYMGAINYLVNLILLDNPQARILFVGHYENQMNPIVSKGQMEVADYWSRRIIKLWELTGWSQKKITTTGYWNNNVWVNSGGVSQEITIKDACLPDKIHPHSDVSGKAVNLYADLLEEEINQHIR